MAYFIVIAGILIGCWNVVISQKIEPKSLQPLDEISRNSRHCEISNIRYYLNPVPVIYNCKSYSKEDINLLTAVGSPLPPDVRPVTGPFGRFGRPAVEFTPQSYVGRWAKDLLPLPFHKNFGIKVTLFLQSIHGGVLFSVLEPDHSSIIFGLNILKVGNSNQSIEFIYKNADEFSSRPITATFILPKFERKWIVFSLAIQDDVITLYFNGCDKILSKTFQVKRSALNIKDDSPVFIGLAGWYIKKPVLFGALYDLTIFKNYHKAIPSCANVSKEERSTKTTAKASKATETTTTSSTSSDLPTTTTRSTTKLSTTTTTLAETTTTEPVITTTEPVSTTTEPVTTTTEPVTTTIEPVSTTTEPVTTTTEPTTTTSTTTTTATSTSVKAKTTLTSTIEKKLTTTPSHSNEIADATKSEENEVFPNKNFEGPTAESLVETTAKSTTKYLLPRTTHSRKNINEKILTMEQVEVYSTNFSVAKVLKLYTEPTLTGSVLDTQDVLENAQTTSTTSHATEITETLSTATTNLREIISSYSTDTTIDINGIKKSFENEIQKIDEAVDMLTTLTSPPTMTTPTTITRSTLIPEQKTTKFEGVETGDKRRTRTSTPSKSGGFGENLDQITEQVIAKIHRQGLIYKNEDLIKAMMQQVVRDMLSGGDGANTINKNSVGISSTEKLGEKGEKGESVKGERGRTGLPGLMGLKGEQGDAGTIGPRGPNGENGVPGLNGLKGNPGLKGELGDPGAPGLNGQPGLNGKPGFNGTHGKEGSMGPAGPRGDKGVKGDVGHPGADGLDGFKGNKGMMGNPGKSTQGQRGPKGDKGDSIVGPKGERGPPGPSSGGSSPRKMVIGEKGEKGERGPVGPEGAQGKRGFVGPRGKPGSPGEGRKGDKGVPGRIGEQGYAGDQGPRGFKGSKGESGLPGNKGRSGAAGVQGQRAHVVFTKPDLDIMVDMFEPGTFVFVSSSEELFIKAISGWLQIPTGNTLFGKTATSNSLSGPKVAESNKKQKIPTPGMIDRRLIDNHLNMPLHGVFIPRPYLLLMALNDPFSGQMTGIGGADYLCYKQARQVSLDGGTFRAFLSDRYQSIKYLVSKKYSNLPVANFQGEQIFESYNSIFNGSGYAAFNPKIPIYSFDLKDVRHDNNWPIKKIWHGSHANGQVHNSGKTCKNWRSESRSEKGTAASIISYTPALNEQSARCHQRLITLCIQVTLR